MTSLSTISECLCTRFLEKTLVTAISSASHAWLRTIVIYNEGLHTKQEFPPSHEQEARKMNIRGLQPST